MEINSTLVPCTDPANPANTLFVFYILDAPTPSTLSLYIKELQKRRVTHLVRVCGPTYDAQQVERHGIHVHSWPFDDGAPPSRAVLDHWLGLLDAELQRQKARGTPTAASPDSPSLRKNHDGHPSPVSTGGDVAFQGTKSPRAAYPDVPTIAVHCVAGLGRAPILVALALVEFGGMPALDAIQFIREKRRGAINQVQMHWLMKYKRRSSDGGCLVM